MSAGRVLGCQVANKYGLKSLTKALYRERISDSGSGACNANGPT